MVQPPMEPPADPPVCAELVEVRDAVRGLEAEVAVRHCVDTPAYWRAMSERLDRYVATSRFQPVDGRLADASADRAYRWLARVAAGYRALAATDVRG
jgi:hypothetical protein